MIRKIRSSMDFRGEISDDEDSIIKYDETQDELSESIIKYNRSSINSEERPNYIYDDKPMIFNREIVTGKINSDDISEEIIKPPTPTPIPIKKEPVSEHRINLKPIALNNMFLDNRLYYYNIYEKNKEILDKKFPGNNYTSIFGSSNSQNHLVGDVSLFPANYYTSNFYNARK